MRIYNIDLGRFRCSSTVERIKEIVGGIWVVDPMIVVRKLSAAISDGGTDFWHILAEDGRKVTSVTTTVTWDPANWVIHVAWKGVRPQTTPGHKEEILVHGKKFSREVPGKIEERKFFGDIDIEVSSEELIEE